MRLIVAGRGRVAGLAACLLQILADRRSDAEVVCVVASAGRLERPSDSFADVALANGLAVVPTLDAACPGPDATLLSVQWPRLLDLPSLGGARAYNLHFAEVPRHRGVHVAYWQVLDRAERIGVTLHEIGPGIDDGAVVAARSAPRQPRWSARAVWRELELLAIDLLAEEGWRLLEHDVPSTPQSGDAVVHRRRDVDFLALEIDRFDRSADEVRAAVLALVAPPAQLPTFRGRQIVHAIVVDGLDTADARAGTVLGERPGLTLVACGVGVVGLIAVVATRMQGER